MLKQSISLVISAVLVGTIAQADDKTAYAKLDEAKALYTQRTDIAKANAAATTAEEAVKLAGTNKDIAYDATILAARARYWVGVHTTDKDQALTIFDQAMNSANAAKTLNADYADSYYYYGVALGRWAQRKGPLASLSRKKELTDSLDATIARKAKDATAGEALDGYGADRIYGRMYFELPGVAGGSKEMSLQYLAKAFDKAPNLALNTVYYAQTLNASGKGEQACKILGDLLLKNPETLNVDRVPETKEEFEEAKQLKADICD